jgi:hypothetical protein
MSAREKARLEHRADETCVCPHHVALAWPAGNTGCSTSAGWRRRVSDGLRIVPRSARTRFACSKSGGACATRTRKHSRRADQRSDVSTGFCPERCRPPGRRRLPGGSARRNCSASVQCRSMHGQGASDHDGGSHERLEWMGRGRLEYALPVSGEGWAHGTDDPAAEIEVGVRLSWSELGALAAVDSWQSDVRREREWRHLRARCQDRLHLLDLPYEGRHSHGNNGWTI